ncbi:MAG: hypothetical protein QG646_4557 [Euryarchaeota archaeon]|nr:hypothetical protein [Euryarchaeota archaeon]
MKLKIKITGPKVHDVGYRYFLMSMAMSNRIRMFEAHNSESDEGQEVLVFADGEDKAIEAFCALVKTKRPARSEVSNISFEAFDGEIMRIGEYAQFCSTVQLNKAIPVLLDMRDDLNAVRKNTDMIPQMSEDIKEMKSDLKAVRKTTESTLEETKAIRKTTDTTLEEIKSLREDIQPGYGMSMRQVQSDIKAIKEQLGMT